MSNLVHYAKDGDHSGGVTHCGLTYDTWGGPVTFTWRAVETSCPKCWILKAREDAIARYDGLEEQSIKHYDSLTHARVLIQSFLNGIPLNKKAEKWVKDHKAYCGRLAIDEYLKDEDLS